MILFIIAAFVLPARNSGHAPSRYPDQTIDSLMLRGIDLTLRQEYGRAREVFRMLNESFPDHPAGAILDASVLQTMAMDYEELVNEEECDSLIRVSKKRADNMIEARPDSPWGYYFLGTALGNEAFAKAQRGDWLGAAITAMASASRFEEALARDSLLIDAYAGLGTYYYWKTRRIEFLTWLPFIADRRAEGIELLERCARSGIYNRSVAASSLISVYLDKEDYQRAKEHAEAALARYPGNRLFLWGLATALEKMGKASEAIDAYRQLLEAIQKDSRPNPYNELVCRMNLYQLRKDAGNEESPEELARIRHLLQERFPGHLAERVKEKRERLSVLERSQGARTD
ncbi:MAG: hypothetical protein HBSIN02_09450 [Bacteroidia bacterium]|nr:MAG: hypothetical protein HBSIN02_09450 [Bacteroidia bacterium]